MMETEAQCQRCTTSNEQQNSAPETVFQLLSSLYAQFNTEPDVASAAERLLNKVRAIKNPSQFANLLHAACKATPRYKTGAKIHVQPDTIRRRSQGVARCSTRLNPGRRAKADSIRIRSKQKALHCLSRRINPAN